MLQRRSSGYIVVIVVIVAIVLGNRCFCCWLRLSLKCELVVVACGVLPATSTLCCALTGEDHDEAIAPSNHLVDEQAIFLG